MTTVPRLLSGLDWPDLARPPRADELSGRLLVLHLWSGGAVASGHVWPVLEDLARRLPGEPVQVVGVHAPRFAHEREPGAVRAAVRRLGVAFPVASDPEHRLRRALGLRGWPTLVLVDPAGRVLLHDGGEPDAAALHAEVVHRLACARAEGLELAITPLAPAPPPPPPLAGGLAWPARLLARGESLLVSDAGRGEVVAYHLPPRGPAREVRRHRGLGRPHGLALDGDGRAYAADPGRQLIWRLDGAGGAPEAVAGDGTLGEAALAPGAFAPGREVALRSPWDLAWDPGRAALVIAMAGAHQLWTLEPARDRLMVLAGSGREARHDADLEDAAFAQPAGVAWAGAQGWVVDAASGAVRLVDLGTGLVRTLAGGDLMDDGDADGPGDQARFQHPGGLALLPGGEAAIVADTFNGRLRRVGRDGRVTTLSPPGLALAEPEGVALQGGRLLVADAGNGRVVAVDLATLAWEVVAGAGSG
jgi:sugar lactone lactonase YvrE